MDYKNETITNTKVLTFQNHYAELKEFLRATAKLLFEICPELGKEMAKIFVPSDGRFDCIFR